ncbi:hypothetical protein GGI43DRAFT_418487 [Trichoderma evansii]
MRFMTEQEAAAEVSKWQVEFKDLKPALVTRKDLWELYKKNNSEWPARICEMGVNAATSILTSSGAFDPLSWVSDRIKDTVKDAVKEKSIDRIAGVYLTDFEEGEDNDYEVEANKKFATKLTSEFATILISAVGGTLTVASGVGAAAVTAIAIAVWLGDLEEAARQKRWGEIVNSMMGNYNDIRQKKLDNINRRLLTKLERLVMSNAYHDLQDQGLIQTYVWKSDNGKNIAQYETVKLKKLLGRVIEIDRGLGEQLWIIDLLEITRIFREETKAFWVAIENNKKSERDFVKSKVIAVMQRQIQSHDIVEEVTTTRVTTLTQQNLVALRKKALEDYGTVAEESLSSTVPDSSTTFTGGAGHNFQ